MVSGKVPFKNPHSWSLGLNPIDLTETIEILGTIYSSNNHCAAHVNKRIDACRRAMYGLASVGCSYPSGLSTDVKLHLWKSVGLPSLLYGLELFTIPRCIQNSIERSQASTIKKTLGFPVRSLSTHLLHASDIKTAFSSVHYNILSLWWRIFQVQCPTRKLCSRMISQFVDSGYVIPGTYYIVYWLLECRQLRLHLASSVHAPRSQYAMESWTA